ncbi:CCA tRNA nucleotidyltransferase [Fredinandcohnia sp. 179-A 10B2 NHS]|uniref:CCA tRNA nucleotidyltransferase n=1 Tax=Fredinandcohnia sp. 179-A 10B2 NHS TaxID=3235176 RepID=UPI0039A0AC15
MDEPFLKAKPILKKLHDNGYDAFFVGGSVRDFLMGRQIGDIDIATSALPEVIMKLFPKTVDVGAVHGTVIVLYENEQYEVTTFRTEDDYNDFRRPSQVQFVKSLYEDLKRRDFTMNAIAMSVDGEIIDPFGGTDSIKNRLIKTVGNPLERFSEDALRMMRAIRFVSQLSFSLCEETKLAITENASLLRKISIERITIEFEKLLKGPNCQEAVPYLIETLLYKYLPGIDSYRESLKTFKSYKWDSLLNRSEYWTLVCYLLQVPHITAFLRLWKLPNKVIDQTIQNLVCLSEVNSKGWTSRLLYESGEECIHQVERIIDVIGGTIGVEAPIDLYRRLPIKKRTDMNVTGQDLINWYEKKPGKWISELLEKIENAILNENIDNNKQKIKEWLFSCNLK